MLSNDFSCRACRNMIYYKCTKDKRNARYIREGSCLMAAPLTENLKAQEGIVEWMINLRDVSTQLINRRE